MRRARALVLSALALLVAARPARAGIIWTASLEEVVTSSSHVALGTFDAKTRELSVERWLRGGGFPDRVVVEGMSNVVLSSLRRARPDDTLGLPPAERIPTSRMYVFLETLDGRLHATGLRRYGRGFAAHASVRVRSTSGRLLAYAQAVNPGDPVPTTAETETFDAFGACLVAELAAHPYVPSPVARPPIPEADRASFFEALGPIVDWYQGDWPTSRPGWLESVPDPPTLRAAGRRLAAWTERAPRAARVHGLDAMMLLCKTVQGGGPDAAPIFEDLRRLRPSADSEAVAAWILREVRDGEYYTDRTRFGLLAKDVGPALYEAVLHELEVWVERTEVNTGTGAWWALASLGETPRAEAAVARRRAREAAEAAATAKGTAGGGGGK